jgi:nicotinate phosphoribosyltransferase
MPMMRGGKRLAASAPLADIRSRAVANLARLPEPLRKLHEPCVYEVEISSELYELAAQVDRESSKH